MESASTGEKGSVTERDPGPRFVLSCRSFSFTQAGTKGVVERERVAK